MTTAVAELPTTLAEAHALILASAAERQAIEAENSRIASEIAILTATNADLAPVIRRPTRGSLKRAPRPRKEFGAHLEQVEIVIEPEIPPGYEGLEKVLIGEDVSKRLDVTPGKFRLIVTRRPKYAYRNRDGVVQPAALPSPDRERPSHRGTSRPDCDGQIRRRLAAVPAEAIYARDSVDLDRSLMAQWMGKVGFELQPLRAERRSCCDCAGRRPGQGRCHI